VLKSRIGEAGKVKVYHEMGKFILKAMITEKVPKGIIHICFG